MFEMAAKNDSGKNNINRIKARKKERERIARIRILSVIAILAVFVFLIIFGITSIINAFKKNKPLPKPEPVNLMSYNEELREVTKKENFVYVEPVKRPVKHQDGASDRLESIKNSQSEEKLCYLTFDDGPNNSVTTQVLDVLRRYDVKATFFMVGALIESNPDVTRRIFEEGHLLANHSYSHNYKNIYSSADAFMTEIKSTEALIKEALDSDADYFPLVRFPGGSHYAGTYKEPKKLIKEHLGTQGFYFCDWNSLNGDAEGAKKDADGLFEYFKKTTNTDKNVVVLMHDAVNKQATVDSLPKIIEYMVDNGYTFLRLDEDI